MLWAQLLCSQWHHRPKVWAVCQWEPCCWAQGLIIWFKESTLSINMKTSNMSPWGLITPPHAHRLTHSSMFIEAYCQTHPPCSLIGSESALWHVSKKDLWCCCSLLAVLDSWKQSRTWRWCIEEDRKDTARTAEQHQSPKKAPECNPAQPIISMP